MLGMNDQNSDIYKIPAFQRRQSINARARKATKPGNKRVLIPQGRVEPFPQVVDRSGSAMSRPVYGKTSVSRPRDAYQHKPTVNLNPNYRGNTAARNIATEALEGIIPGSVPKTLFGRIKTRMARDEDYNELGFEEEEQVQHSVDDGNMRRMQCVGIVTMYFEKIQVAVVDLVENLSVGEMVIFEQKDNCLFEQRIETMQCNKKDIRHARRRQEIGTKVLDMPKLGGKVWKVV